MREIRFRVWDKHLKVLRDVTSIDFETKEVTYLLDGEMAYITRDFVEAEIMQYTGFKDKNGTEIYEGDVIHAKGYYPGDGWANDGEGEYNIIRAIRFDKEQGAWTCGEFLLGRIDHDCEVIGSVYEVTEVEDDD